MVTNERRRYNAQELALIRAGKLEKAKTKWAERYSRAPLKVRCRMVKYG